MTHPVTSLLQEQSEVCAKNAADLAALDATSETTALEIADAAWCPEPAPLAFPAQSFENAPNQEHGMIPLAWQWGSLWSRIFVFSSALFTTLYVTSVLGSWFAQDYFSAFEILIVGLISLTFFWIAFSVSTATLGLFLSLKQRLLAPGVNGDAEHILDQSSESMNEAAQQTTFKTALLLPIYQEDPVHVFGNASAMMAQLQTMPEAQDYCLFILSDTIDLQIAAQEERAFVALRAKFGGEVEVYYSRRTENTDYKVGNIAQWVRMWGDAYDAMLVLDADSVMSAKAIVSLRDSLEQDPSLGLVQSFPRLIGARSVFGRMQQFANRIYGGALAQGLSSWAGHEGNYWGHNAIIRTKGFAAAAGLPKLDAPRDDKQLILSHDFIEAALLRRAGWGVRFSHDAEDSYEEVPQTLIDYVIRDRRWCQGNLQHLRLVTARGFHMMSRFHLLAGAMGYLTSPMWLLLLLIWAGFGTEAGQSTFQYFSGYNPQVNWPDMMSSHHMAMLFFMYGMLLAPKVMGLVSLKSAGVSVKALGGVGPLTLSFVTELILSVLYAPIMMIQQTMSVVRVMLGAPRHWEPQHRTAQSYSMLTLLRFHWLETVLGVGLWAAILTDVASLWLLPIALSLLLALPLSALGALFVNRHLGARHLMATPEHVSAPKIWEEAMREREYFKEALRPIDVYGAPRNSLKAVQEPSRSYASQFAREAS